MRREARRSALDPVAAEAGVATGRDLGWAGEPFSALTPTTRGAGGAEGVEVQALGADTLDGIGSLAATDSDMDEEWEHGVGTFGSPFERFRRCYSSGDEAEYDT